MSLAPEGNRARDFGVRSRLSTCPLLGGCKSLEGCPLLRARARANNNNSVTFVDPDAVHPF